jgi:DNA-directed RNA polymerase subunit H (RpoH/RPB5)
MTNQKGQKIGEDKHSEHWSLDGHSYVKVPKWVIEQLKEENIMKNYIKIDDIKIELTDEQVKEIIVNNQIEKLELEDHNFKVNSDGWVKKTSNDIEYLENKEGDIVEIINHPDLSGEQLFTWDAAMRETEKAGKRMPTDDEFDIIFKDNNKDVVKNIKYCGYRSTDGFSFYYLNVSTFWWSSSQSSSTNSWRRYLNRDYSDVLRGTYYKLNGFSVRCVK